MAREEVSAPIRIKIQENLKRSGGNNLVSAVFRKTELWPRVLGSLRNSGLAGCHISHLSQLSSQHGRLEIKIIPVFLFNLSSSAFSNTFFKFFYGLFKGSGDLKIKRQKEILVIPFILGYYVVRSIGTHLVLCLLSLVFTGWS